MNSSTRHIFEFSDTAVQVCIWVTYGAVCQVINLFGITTNVINIICFVKQGFQDSVNISLLGLAISDLGSLITVVWSCICLTPGVITADLVFDPVEVMYLTAGMPHLSFTRVSSCITAMITLERCLCITAPLKVKRIITPKRTTVVNVVMFIVFLCSGCPMYVVNKLGFKFSLLRNKTLYGLVSTDDRQMVEMISFAANNIFIPFGSFVIIVVCTAVLSFKLHKTTKWRQTTSNSTQSEKVSSRNQKTAKMVVMISALFIISFIPVNANMLAMALIPELSLYNKYFHITLIISGFGTVMESINSSMNICIYHQMSSKYRETFGKLFHV